jgi:hypothetical protein
MVLDKKFTFKEVHSRIVEGSKLKKHLKKIERDGFTVLSAEKVNGLTEEIDDYRGYFQTTTYTYYYNIIYAK